MTNSTLPNPAKILKDKFAKSLGFACESVLPESQIQQVIDELSIKYKSRLFDPFVTLWTFILQILDFDKRRQRADGRRQKAYAQGARYANRRGYA